MVEKEEQPYADEQIAALNKQHERAVMDLMRRCRNMAVTRAKKEKEEALEGIMKKPAQAMVRMAETQTHLAYDRDEAVTEGEAMRFLMGSFKTKLDEEMSRYKAKRAAQDMLAAEKKQEGKDAKADREREEERGTRKQGDARQQRAPASSKPKSSSDKTPSKAQRHGESEGDGRGARPRQQEESPPRRRSRSPRREKERPQSRSRPRRTRSRSPVRERQRPQDAPPAKQAQRPLPHSPPPRGHGRFGRHPQADDLLANLNDRGRPKDQRGQGGARSSGGVAQRGGGKGGKARGQGHQW